MAFLAVLIVTVILNIGLYAYGRAVQEGRKLQRRQVRAHYNDGAWYGRTNKVW